MEEVFDSLVSVSHASTVLVAIGDPMWDVVRINGSQVIQSIARVRAAGIRAQPRGNESHTLTFSLCVIAESVEAAAKAAAHYAHTLPKTMADVTVKFADDTGITLKDAAIASWQAENSDPLGRHTLTIIGGEIVTI